MDLESYRRRYDYSRACDEMMAATNSRVARWYVVEADDKRRARLNCIAHLLSLIPYENVLRKRIRLRKRQKPSGYREPARNYKYVADTY